MSDKTRTLRIVPYNPNDYSLGEALAKEDGTKAVDEATISAALSLYFQWEEHRTAMIYSDEGAHGLSCEMDYDRDERSPSEIRIKLPNSSDIAKFKEFQKVTIRFEVFRICYEFESELLATVQDSEDFSLIINPPSSITVYKARRLPRIYITDQDRAPMPPVFWQSKNSSEKISIQITELGMKSIATKAIPAISEKEGTLYFGDLAIQGEFFKTIPEKSVFLLKFETGLESGKYFDFYRTFAYPALRSRYEYPYEDGIALYEQTGYFGDKECNKDSLFMTWEGQKSGIHQTSADFYIADESNKLIGSSSATLAFLEGTTEVWSFHQLCALKIPDLVELSGILYTWRAEYLAAKPYPLKVSVWYTSKSRWLERLYTKFFNHSVEHGSKFFPVHGKLATLSKSEQKIPLNEIKIGDHQRITFSDETLWAGSNPMMLNANGYLDCIVNFSGQTDPETIKTVGGSICSKMDKNSMQFLISSTEASTLDAIDGEPQKSDRLCIFEKNDLISLLCTIEHSVAVTNKKLNDDYN